MKKIILLLVLPLTILMAIDFTMTEKGLFAKTTTESPAPAPAPTPGTDPKATNPYFEPVDLPECDASNPEVQFIRSNDDWKTINSSNKRIFCVSPGNYTSLRNIAITTSGTPEKRRYIILNNGNDLHPAKLGDSEVASFALDFNNASYWTVDRMATLDRNSFNVILENGSTHNIFNRMHQRNFEVALWIKNGCHYNTIQNSRFNTMTYQSFAADLSSIQVVDGVSPFVVKHTKIVNNEFVDCKPGRFNRFYGTQENHGQYANFDGSVFDSNNVEYTTALRTDGNGNYTPTGAYVAAETSGFAAKSGSLDENNPVILSNNHVWGLRRTDPTFTNLSGSGIGFVVYMGARYVHVKNNVIFDGTGGITIADRYDEPYGTQYAEITGNLIVDCGARPGAPWSTSLLVASAYYPTIENNTIINPIGNDARVQGNYAGVYYGKNTVVNPDAGTILVPNNSLNTVYATAAEGGYTEDYAFVTDKFTNNPRTITLKNVLKAN